jgi:hypothetical protein
MVKRAMALAVAMLAAATLAGCGSGPKHVITYDVLQADLTGGNAADLAVNQIEYTYTTGGGQGPSDGGALDAGTPLPWHKTMTVHGDLYQIFLNVVMDVPAGTDVSQLPTVQCQITVDGKLIMTHNNPGGVDCLVKQNDLR